jgi:transposase
MRRMMETGSVAPGKMGASQAETHSSGARGPAIATAQERRFTSRVLVRELAERGLKIDYQSVWAFVRAEKLSLKSAVAFEVARRPPGCRPRYLCGSSIQSLDRTCNQSS